MVENEGEVPEVHSKALGRRGFKLTGLLGRGASGRVFKATQESLNRAVAVKFFDNEYNAKNEPLRVRFIRESKLLASVTSPYIPYVVTNGELTGGRGTPYYVMQFVPGRQLEETLAKGRLKEEQAISIARQVLEGLAAAHRARVVHRDVSRRNVLEHEGRCYLIDFSISGPLDPSGVTAVTKTGEHIGTIEYAAPEQRIDLRKTDERTDVYSTGVLLFEMLAGHTRVRLGSLQRDLPGVRSALRTIIMKACAEDPAGRFPSASDFAAALSEVLPRPRLSRTEEATALCPGLACGGANWSRRGYYRGPRVWKTSGNHCDECGSELIYDCRTCGEAFNEKPHCSGCGAKFFEIPLCKSCGSLLEATDLDADTAKLGCGKCRRAATASGWNDYIPSDPGSDDIPF